MESSQIQETKFKTLFHISMVSRLMNRIARVIIKRGEEHDKTKLESPELDGFVEHTEKLSSLTYGSNEYKKALDDLKPTLDHHYANNRHHPEHFKNGMTDMNLVDLVEMFCDWKTSSTRQNNGNIRQSLEVNAKRFDMSPQLIKILENTIDLFGEE